VHALFTEKHCDQIRASDPACKIIVHPECRWEVVQKADLAGSTEYIAKVLEEAPEDSRWAVGTEIHLVSRLADRYAGRKAIRSLAGVQCLCTTMYRIDLPHLAWCLDELAAGRIVNPIKVDEDTRHWARVSLQRMLENVYASPVAAK
jgi:quinolinate synthase